MLGRIVQLSTISGTADCTIWQRQQWSHSTEDMVPEAEVVDPVASEDAQQGHLRGRILRVINGQLFFVDRGSPSLPASP